MTKVWTGELSTFRIDEELLSKVREVYPDIVTLTARGIGEHPYFDHDGDGLFLRRRDTFPRNPDAKPSPTMPERPAGTSVEIRRDGNVAHVPASADTDSVWTNPPVDPDAANW